MLRVLVFISVGFLFLACASDAPVYVPVPALDSPEMRGQNGKMSWGAGASSIYKLSLIKNGATRPPNVNPGSIHDPVDVLLQSYASTQFADHFAVQGGLSYPFGAFVKILTQLMGERYAKARPGNFSLLFSLEGRHIENNNGGDQQYTFGAGGYKWSTKSISQTLLASLSMGYRLTEGIMLFWGGGLGTGILKGDLDQKPASDGSDNGYKYGIGPRGTRTSTIGMGLDISTLRHHFSPRLMLTSLHYDSDFRQDFGLAFDWHWDFGMEKASDSP